VGERGPQKCYCSLLIRRFGAARAGVEAGCKLTKYDNTPIDGRCANYIALDVLCWGHMRLRTQ